MRDCVRAAIPADLSRVAEILVFAKRAAYRPIFRDDASSFGDLQVLPLAREYQDGARSLADTLVLDDGVVKGVLTRRFGGDRAELCELYVEPCFQGCGVGRALLTAFLTEATARGCNAASLWVIAANVRAVGFYERFGFAPTGESRLVEGTSVPELRLSAALPPPAP